MALITNNLHSRPSYWWTVISSPCTNATQCTSNFCALYWVSRRIYVTCQCSPRSSGLIRCNAGSRLRWKARRMACSEASPYRRSHWTQDFSFVAVSNVFVEHRTFLPSPYRRSCWTWDFFSVAVPEISLNTWDFSPVISLLKLWCSLRAVLHKQRTCVPPWQGACLCGNFVPRRSQIMR